MDAVKVIKKHGTPGGIPTITAYIDESAPGELPAYSDSDNGKTLTIDSGVPKWVAGGVILFEHHITIAGQGFSVHFIIVSNNAGAYTYTSLSNWMRMTGLVDSSKIISCSGSWLDSQNVRLYIAQGLYANSSNVIQAQTRYISYSFLSTIPELNITEGSAVVALSSDDVTITDVFKRIN